MDQYFTQKSELERKREEEERQGKKRAAAQQQWWEERQMDLDAAEEEKRFQEKKRLDEKARFDNKLLDAKRGEDRQFGAKDAAHPMDRERANAKETKEANQPGQGPEKEQDQLNPQGKKRGPSSYGMSDEPEQASDQKEEEKTSATSKKENVVSTETDAVSAPANDRAHAIAVTSKASERSKTYLAEKGQAKAPEQEVEHSQQRQKQLGIQR